MIYYRIITDEELNMFKPKHITTSTNFDISQPFKSLWFSNNQILEYLNRGKFIATISIPDNTEMYQLSSCLFIAKTIQVNDVFPITVKVLDELIQNGIDVHVNNDVAICHAVETGNIDLVKYLHGVHGLDLSTREHLPYHICEVRKHHDINIDTYNEIMEYIIMNSSKPINIKTSSDEEECSENIIKLIELASAKIRLLKEQKTMKYIL